MKVINFTEYRARHVVDRLFNANAARRGQICEWPVIGGHYVSGVDPTQAMKETSRRALFAREWFAQNGPPGLPPLPLSHNEREDLKCGRGLLLYLLALYARSLDGRNFDFNEHPPFADYVSGVLWEVERGRIGVLPHCPSELAEIRKRFPPRPLKGLGPGFCWEPVNQTTQPTPRSRRGRTRAAS